MEKEELLRRIKEGIRKSKKKNGRPKLTCVKKVLQLVNHKKKSVIARELNISRQSIYNILKVNKYDK